MQVKKFEATNMSEALEMVKIHLGPDAIILSVKDNSAGFGLMGKKSIEVTAAISQKQLERKQWAEGRLSGDDLLKLRKSPARSQKHFIEKSVNRYLKPQVVENVVTPVQRGRETTQTRYIDIGDDQLGNRVDQLLKRMGSSVSQTITGDGSATRVKQAARNALDAFERTNNVARVAYGDPEVENLRAEVQELKKHLFDLRKQQSSNPWVKSIDLPPEFKECFDRLIRSGLSESVVTALLQQAREEVRPEQYKTALIEAWVVKKLLSDIKISDSSRPAPIQIFIGPRGHGKTTHLVKMASHYVIHENKKVAIFTADQNKVGATDQLRIYAQILNVPFGVIRSAQDWENVRQNMANFDYVFVDYPGSSIKNINEMSEIRRLLPPVTMEKDIHLTLSVTCKDDDAIEFAERYKFCNYKDVVFTFLDESVNHGLVYNFSKMFSIPLHSFGVGSKIPEDFEFATRERVIDLIFKISKLW